MASTKGWDSKQFTTLAAALLDLRRRHQMSQKQLAKRIGVSPEYVELVEQNRRRPGVDLRKRIASVLGVTFDDLQEICIRDQPPPVRIPPEDLQLVAPEDLL